GARRHAHETSGPQRSGFSGERDCVSAPWTCERLRASLSTGRSRTPARPASERLQAGLLVLDDGEQLVELGDLEDFVDLGVDLAQHELAAGALQLAVQGDQLAQRGAGQELDVLEVEQDLPAAELVDELEELLADHLDVLFVEDLLVHEVHDGDVTNVFDFQPAAARLRTHGLVPGV